MADSVRSFSKADSGESKVEKNLAKAISKGVFG